MARAIRNAIRANRFARIDSHESFAIETPIFVVHQADSPESLEFPIRANRATKLALPATRPPDPGTDYKDPVSLTHHRFRHLLEGFSKGS